MGYWPFFENDEAAIDPQITLMNVSLDWLKERLRNERVEFQNTLREGN